MRVLCTGGSGFICSNLVDKLIELGHEVIVIDNESAECNERFYYNPKVLIQAKFDIADYNLIAPLFKDVDVVFHMAAESRIQPAILNPTKAVRTNVLGTCNVLQAAREHGVKRVIYTNTSAGYGLKNKPPLREDMPRDCLNPYSVSKCCGEDLCLMYTRLYGLETVVFRLFNIIGPREPIKGQYAPVVGLFLRQFKSGQSMTVVGDGLQRRDMTSVHDVVKANILAANLDNKLPVGEIMNIGTGINHSIMDIVEMIDGPYMHIPERPGEARETLACIDKAKALLPGWEPDVNFLENWIKENLDDGRK